MTDLVKYSRLTRDYSSYVKLLSSLLGDNNSDLTDFTISEPDILYLSYVSNCYDFLSYIIDKYYSDSTIDKIKEEDLSIISRFFGRILKLRRNNTIPVIVSNKNNDSVHIDISTPILNGNEIYSFNEEFTVSSNSNYVTEIVRGNRINKIYNKNQYVNGDITLIDDANPYSIIIQIVTSKGLITLKPSEFIENFDNRQFDLNYIFGGNAKDNENNFPYKIIGDGEGPDSDKIDGGNAKTITSGSSSLNESDKYTFSIYELSENQFILKLNTYAYKLSKSVIVSYTLVNDNATKIDSIMSTPTIDSVDVNVLEQSDVKSLIDLDSLKLKYLSTLFNETIVYNNEFIPDFDILNSKIVYSDFEYETNSAYPYPTLCLNYITLDDKPLDGSPDNLSSVTYITEADSSNLNYVSVVWSDRDLPYSIIVSYDGQEKYISNPKSIGIINTPGRISNDVYISFIDSNLNRLNNYYKISSNTVETLTNEYLYLISKYKGITLSNYSEYTINTFLLKPVVLPLSGTYSILQTQSDVTLSKLTEDVISTVTEHVLSDTFNTNSVVSMASVREIILKNISYIIDVSFTNQTDKIIINKESYLKIGKIYNISMRKGDNVG